MIAALIVVICAGMGLLDSENNLILAGILGAAFFLGVLRPAWIYWSNQLNKDDVQNI